jgi:hypothetical protein
MSQIGRGSAYENIPSEQYWPESTSAAQGTDFAAQEAKAKRNRLLKWGGIIFGVLAVIAIVVGVTVSQVTKNKGGSGSSSNSGSSGSGGTAVLNGTDASEFEKDSRLHQSFWALAYTPEGAILPNCNVQQANVTRDIQVSPKALHDGPR